MALWRWLLNVVTSRSPKNIHEVMQPPPPAMSVSSAQSCSLVSSCKITAGNLIILQPRCTYRRYKIFRRTMTKWRPIFRLLQLCISKVPVLNYYNYQKPIQLYFKYLFSRVWRPPLYNMVPPCISISFDDETTPIFVNISPIIRVKWMGSLNSISKAISVTSSGGL
jgi:hypothetical protein